MTRQTTTVTVQFKDQPFTVAVSVRRNTEYRDLRKKTFVGTDNEAYPNNSGTISPGGLFGISSPTRDENDPALTNKIWKAFNAMEVACKEQCLALAFGNE